MRDTAVRRAAGLTAALCLALAGALPAAAAPEVDPDKAVIDNADILTRDTETYITDLSTALQESCGAQIGVYTVEYIGNYTMEGYTYELANAWGLGDAERDNGIVLVLAPGEDDYRAMCGAGLETQFTVPMLQTILDEELLPSWEEGDYDAGARATVRAMADQLCTIYGLSLDLDDPAASLAGTASGARPARQSAFPWVGLVVLLVVLVFALVLFARPRGPGYRGPRFIFLGGWRPRPPRPPYPPRPPRRPPPPPRGGFGGPRPGGPRPPRPGGGFRAGGGGFRSGGAGRSGGGSFRAGGGSFRGGGAGRRH